MRRSLLLGVGLVAAWGCQRQPLLPPLPPTAARVPAEAATPAAKSAAVPTPSAQPDALQARAQVMYKERCALCHGRTGHGDGIAAVNLRPLPRSLHDAAWQASVRDADIAAIIVGGGAAVGKSRMMPPSPDLKDEPALVAALVGIVRRFAAP